MEIYKIQMCVMPFVLLFCDTFFASDCPEVASSVGQNFMFGVPSKEIGSSDFLFVHITPISNSPAHVRITSPFNNYDQQFIVENVTYVRLLDTIVHMDSGLEFKGIEVSSNASVSVAVIAFNGALGSEAFLVLPITALSTRYVAASYQPINLSNSSVLVVGVQNNTSVSIQYKINGQNSFALKHFTLQKFTSFLLQDSHDLSGTLVISSKPVAVISGSHKSRIPVGVGKANYLVEQMIPNKYWSNTFIVPPIYPSMNYIVKILVDKNNTEIHCYNSTSHFAVSLDEGSVYEVMFGSDPTVIQANNPISLFQYFSNIGNIYGYPYMTTVQGISQFVNSYKFYTSYLAATDRTIAVTVPRNSLSGLQLDGKNTSWWNAKIIPVPKPMDDYITMFINVSSNLTHIIHHINGISFGASVYFQNDGLLAYGYPLQLSLSECDAQKPTTPSITSMSSTAKSLEAQKPTTPSITSMSSTAKSLEAQKPTTPSITSMSSTAKSLAATNTYLVDNNRNGTWCMKCDNMLHLKYCDSVTRCENEHNVCYVQAYTRSEGNLAYRSGCIDRSNCQNHEGNVHCHQCCDGNFCNIAGCGDQGLPALNTRGPLCFDCTHKGEEDICQTLQLCEQGQVCKVEKDKWGSSFHYTMGCVEKTECSSKRSVYDIQSRNVIACSRCCDSDFCNQNCTTHHNPAIIG